MQASKDGQQAVDPVTGHLAVASTDPTTQAQSTRFFDRVSGAEVTDQVTRDAAADPAKTPGISLKDDGTFQFQAGPIARQNIAGVTPAQQTQAPYATPGVDGAQSKPTDYGSFLQAHPDMATVRDGRGSATEGMRGLLSATTADGTTALFGSDGSAIKGDGVQAAALKKGEAIEVDNPGAGQDKYVWSDPKTNRMESGNTLPDGVTLGTSTLSGDGKGGYALKASDFDKAVAQAQDGSSRDCRGTADSGMRGLMSVTNKDGKMSLFDGKGAALKGADGKPLSLEKGQGMQIDNAGKGQDKFVWADPQSGQMQSGNALPTGVTQNTSALHGDGKGSYAVKQSDYDKFVSANAGATVRDGRGDDKSGMRGLMSATTADGKMSLFNAVGTAIKGLDGGALGLAKGQAIQVDNPGKGQDKFVWADPQTGQMQSGNALPSGVTAGQDTLHGSGKGSYAWVKAGDAAAAAAAAGAP